ncbi:hypothetical protein OZX67_09355 [Bifidobacterium sp. ESL0728]|uniref:hypothetical protein n=1 Tax=Bifidobacterium sp. ESL0728 TaxID=2983220 RepID=UPI0023FA0CCE|nr:hypothetical protein [Bifidobacterium sp. ESL0728]WEV58973.1 hypothetical protein OZX67_09355 [Bifidobacterium sp. ESL0728]
MSASVMETIRENALELINNPDAPLRLKVAPADSPETDPFDDDSAIFDPLKPDATHLLIGAIRGSDLTRDYTQLNDLFDGQYASPLKLAKAVLHAWSRGDTDRALAILDRLGLTLTVIISDENCIISVRLHRENVTSQDNQ